MTSFCFTMCGHFPIPLLVKAVLLGQVKTKSSIVLRTMDVVLAPTIILQFLIHTVINSTRKTWCQHCRTYRESTISLVPVPVSCWRIQLYSSLHLIFSAVSTMEYVEVLPSLFYMQNTDSYYNAHRHNTMTFH